MTSDEFQPKLEDSDAPVTKADLLQLWQAIESRFARTASQESLDNLAEHLGTFREQIENSINENRDHFDAALENIRDELVGANKDEISGLHDGHQDHEARIANVEAQAGLR